MFSYISLELIWVCMIMVQPNQGCGPPTSCMLPMLLLDFSPPEYRFRISSNFGYFGCKDIDPNISQTSYIWITIDHNHVHEFSVAHFGCESSPFEKKSSCLPRICGGSLTSQVHQAWRKRKRLCMDTLSTLGAGEGRCYSWKHPGSENGGYP